MAHHVFLSPTGGATRRIAAWRRLGAALAVIAALAAAFVLQVHGRGPIAPPDQSAGGAAQARQLASRPAHDPAYFPDQYENQARDIEALPPQF